MTAPSYVCPGDSIASDISALEQKRQWIIDHLETSLAVVRGFEAELAYVNARLAAKRSDYLAERVELAKAGSK